MAVKIARRDTLKLMAGASAATIIGAPAIVRAADEYPSRPITLINPNPPTGYNDALCRVMSGPLGKAFGQPVTVVNIPGAGQMLGHQYFLKQPQEGYFLLAGSTSFIPMNILLQHATFKVDDFQMINIPARDYTMMATSVNNDKLKTAQDVADALKKDASSLSVGVPRASTDRINQVLFAKSIGVDPTKMRLVTFESGGNVRTAVVGGVVDIGFVGGEGFEPLADQVRPLLTLDSHRHDPFTKTPTADEAKIGTHFDTVVGSLRGFAVSAVFKEKFPDRYAKVISVFEKTFKDPTVVKSLETQSLATEWYGPDDSQALLVKLAEQLKDNVKLLQGG